MESETREGAPSRPGSSLFGGLAQLSRFSWPLAGRNERAALVALLIALWLVSGFYKVAPDEAGVVLRFGAWVATEPPGLHYHLPYPVETVLLPKVTKVSAFQTAESRMLTGDENIVEAGYSVAWRIRDAGAFLFHVEDPEALIRMVAETAVREVIGENPILAAFSDHRQQITEEAKAEMQSLLDSYGAGVEILDVRLERVDPPPAVIDAFNDVQRARADQVRARNEAEAYRNDLLPRARGEAARITGAARAYRAETLARANGDIAAARAAYAAYQAAPAVFAARLYYDSLDAVLARSREVVLATENGLAALHLLHDGAALTGAEGVSGEAKTAPVAASQGRGGGAKGGEAPSAEGGR
jgi:membrane protease subunit HflK